MTGRRILRVEDGRFEVAVEAPYATEAHLHDAIAEHPEVLPSEDLGRGPLITVAVELDLGAGPMDLLVVDPRGRLAIVEFKRGTENPDVRVVVAQVLDYGSSLWRLPYEELERRPGKAQRPSGEGELVEYAEEAFARLGVESFDAPAFVDGVAASLESGDFAFVYVGRDLDERTRRIMTFLSEGAKMTFFAVEVDHYRAAGADSAVMVPRTAFVPSWIAGGTSPARRQAGTPLTERLAQADDATRELIAKMDVLAASEGLVRKQGASGYRYLAPDGVGYVGVYTSGRGMEFNMEALQDATHARFVDDVVAALSEALGSPIGGRSSPSIPCNAAITHWSMLADRAIKPFLALKRAEPGPPGLPQG